MGDREEEAGRFELIADRSDAKEVMELNSTAPTAEFIREYESAEVKSKLKYKINFKNVNREYT